LKVEKIAYFKIDTGIVKSITFDNHSYPMDLKLEDLENELDPGIFYRVNRQYIVHRDAIENIKFHFNGKLIVNVHPVCDERIMVSKAKATDFKTWMNS
jgi:DNA-binding LytR/AlgR family response regulator